MPVRWYTLGGKEAISVMKTVLGGIRKADGDFGMIDSGDHVAVGVSGGKDSLLLLYALSLYRKFEHKDFELHGITLKMGLEPFDTSPVSDWCKQLGIPFDVVETDIAKIVFDIRKEPNPCSLCAKMRRGALNDAAKRLGCNKVALGHHREDAIETLMMSMIFEGRLHTFHPNMFLPGAEVTVIRPMVYVSEKHIIHVARKLELPVVHNPCPMDGHSRRQEIKQMIASMCRTYPHLKDNMLAALKNAEQYGLWDKKKI